MSPARATVLRSAILFAPFLAVTLALLAFIIVGAADDGLSAGRVIGLVVVGLVGLLLSFQEIQSLRDLFSQPVETVGLVDRRWSRHDFFIFRNDYLFVERDVFRITPEQLLEIELGDTVRIKHYPHTSVVEEIDVVARAADRERERDG